MSAHRSLLPEVPTRAATAYHLSGIQSAAWHDAGAEGVVVRGEIIAAARDRPVYDVDGRRLFVP